MSDDDINYTTHLKWFGIPQIIKFTVPHKRLILFLIISQALGSLLDASIPLFQDYAINHYVGENTTDTLPWFIFLYVVVILLSAVLNMAAVYSACTAEVRVDRDVRRACFNHVQELSPSYFSTHSVGYVHSRVISDPNKIGIILSWMLIDVVYSSFYIIGIFIYMFILNVKLALIMLAVLPFIVAVTFLFRQKITAESRKVREFNSILTGDFNQGVTGIKTIKTLVVEDSMQKEFEQDSGKMFRVALHCGRYMGLFRSVVIALSSVALALILWAGGKLTVEGLMLIGTLSVFMNYATSISGHIQNLTGTVSNLISSQVNIERVHKLLNTESDVKDSPEVIEKYGDSFNPKKENWEELNGDIKFDDITFKYPDAKDGDYVLENFSLDVPKGTMVAIVGETGAGKSTLINLACRFYEPTMGRVLIDGRDARERSQLWLHSHIGYVLQTPHLFSGTIRDNLLYGNPDATFEQMQNAIRCVHAEKIIERMPNGYDSEVGEGGDLLSMGEKQLISFARAILADPEILVLDEATSSVDTITEKAIQSAISEITSTRTSFIVAHRLSTIQNADIIIVMKDGKIVEQGKHRELMEKKGYYYSLYTTQFAEDSTAKAYESKK